MTQSVLFSRSGTTRASAGTETLFEQVGLGDFDAVTIVAEVVGATGGTLDLLLESKWSSDDTWYSLYRFPQLTAGAAAAVYKITFGLGNTVTTIAKDGGQTLATSTVAAGHWGDRIRLFVTAGASTSAGAAVKFKIIGHRVSR